MVSVPDSPNASTTSNGLPTLSSVLTPTMSKHRNSDGYTAVRGLILRGLTVGFTSPRIRSWCRSEYATDAVKKVASSDSEWRRLTADAFAYRESSTSPDGRARRVRSTTERLVVSLLAKPSEVPGSDGTPRPMSTRSLVSAKAATAIVGLRLLERAEHTAFDSVRFDTPRMAVALGASRGSTGAAATALKTAIAQGWIRLNGDLGKGRSREFKIANTKSGPRAIAAAVNSDLIDLASDRATEFGSVLRAASHPAIAYGGLGFTAWLSALLRAASLSPEAVGLTATGSRRALKAWDAAVHATRSRTELEIDPPDWSVFIKEALDNVADRNGAVEAYKAAERERQRLAAERREATEQVKADRALVQRAVQGAGADWWSTVAKTWSPGGGATDSFRVTIGDFAYVPKTHDAAAKQGATRSAGVGAWTVEVEDGTLLLTRPRQGAERPRTRMNADKSAKKPQAPATKTPKPAALSRQVQTFTLRRSKAEVQARTDQILANIREQTGLGGWGIDAVESTPDGGSVVTVSRSIDQAA